jgi:hypothetical protein
MKTLVWSITNYNRTPQQPNQPPQQARGMKGLTVEEVRLVSRIFTSGVTCLRLFTDSGEVTCTQCSSNVP